MAEKKDDKKVVNAAPDQEFNDDGTKNPDFVPPKKEGEGEAPDTKKDGEDDKDKEEEFDDKVDSEKPPVVPIRKSTAQHIIARKNNKIKKLESELDGKGKDEEDGEDDAPEDKEDDLTPEASGAIEEAVKRQIDPLMKKIISDTDEAELKDLFTSEPDAKKYENHIKAYMGHEMYKGVPPAVIYHHLAFNHSQAIGAKKKKVADLEANQHRNGGRNLAPKGGTGIGDLPTPEEIAEMSEADFEKMEEAARQGKYLKK